jgi:hypothetical protein
MKFLTITAIAAIVASFTELVQAYPAIQDHMALPNVHLQGATTNGSVTDHVTELPQHLLDGSTTLRRDLAKRSLRDIGSDETKAHWAADHLAISRPTTPRDIHFPDPIIPTKDPKLLAYYRQCLDNLMVEENKTARQIAREKRIRDRDITEWDYRNGCFLDTNRCTMKLLYWQWGPYHANNHHADYLNLVAEGARLGSLGIGRMLRGLMEKGIPLEDTS